MKKLELDEGERFIRAEPPAPWWVRLAVWALGMVWRPRKSSTPTPLVVISASLEATVRWNALEDAAIRVEAHLQEPDPGPVDAGWVLQQAAASIRALKTWVPVLASNPLEADRVPSYYELATMYRDLWAERNGDRDRADQQAALMKAREEHLVAAIEGWQGEVKKLHARCADAEASAAALREALERFEPGWGQGVVETEGERETMRQEGLEAALQDDAGKDFLAQLRAANDHSELYREAWAALGAPDCGLLKWRAVLDEIEAVREERDQLKAGSVSPPSGWGNIDAALTELQQVGLLERTPEGFRIVGGAPSAAPPSGSQRPSPQEVKMAVEGLLDRNPQVREKLGRLIDSRLPFVHASAASPSGLTDGEPARAQAGDMAELNALGWISVFHHECPQGRSFWVFIHSSGLWATAEGANEAEALAYIRAEAVKRGEGSRGTAEERPIIMDPRVFGGRPSLRGARIAVEHILGTLAAGVSVDGLFKAYPSLDRADVLACLRYAHQLVSGLIPLVPEWWRTAVNEERARCARIARACGRGTWAGLKPPSEVAATIASEIENERRDDGVPRIESGTRHDMPSNQCGTGDHPGCRLLDCGCDCHPPTKWNGREHEIQAGGAA